MIAMGYLHRTRSTVMACSSHRPPATYPNRVHPAGTVQRRLGGRHRDRAGTFEPQIVRKRQRRLSGVDEMALSLYAKGLTTREISAHFAEIYGASVSKETISRVTAKVIEEMTDWCNRPLEASTPRSSSTR
jgi:transposase-like protein